MSCGPVNAIQKLSAYSQVDRSLQHEPQQRVQANAPGFRTQQSNTLEREFQAHQQGAHHFDPMFSQAFAGPAPIHPMAHQQAPVASSSSSWANDFKMNAMPQHPQQTQNWNTQFMSQMNSQGQQARTAQAQAQAQAQVQHQMQQAQFNTMNTMYTPQLSHNYALAGTGRMTEHQELHSMHLNSQLENIDGEFDALDKEFDKLEQEFKNVKMDEPAMEKQPEMELPVDNNAGFRQAAKEVADVMKSNQSNKFANSKFLDLMNRVSAGQVGLNQDETKLVDTQGNDIHEASSKSADPSQEGAQSGSHANLPDPLEFVKDGELAETPFAAAKMVGQQHQEKYTWDDVYEDYRHDDTSF